MTHRLASLGLPLLAAFLMEGARADAPDADDAVARQTVAAIPREAVSPPPLDPLNEAARHLAHGEHLRLAGDRSGATIAWTAALDAPAAIGALAAWRLAEHHMSVGEVQAALDRCSALVNRWPDTPHAEDCGQLIPFAFARLGRVDEARRTSAAWDARHPREPIAESVDLTLAISLSRTDPEAAVPRLRTLATTFTAPLTGRLAAEALTTLHNHGHANATLPDSLLDRLDRARSLRATGQRDAAWEAFARVVGDAEDHPALLDEIAEDAEDFAWSTRRYDELAARFLEEDPEATDPELLWKRYRALDRGGRSDEALAIGLAALEAHGRHRDWRRKEEVLARTAMFAGRYEVATRLFDTCAGSRGTGPRRCRFYAAFSAVMDGAVVDARRRLDTIVEHDPGLRSGARYWRARLLAEIDPEQAASDLAWLREHVDDDWYGLLARDDGQGRHAGRWPGIRVRTPAPASPTLAGTIHARGDAPAWFTPVRSDPSLRARTDRPWPGGLTPEVAAGRARLAVAGLGPSGRELSVAIALADAGLRTRSGPLVSRWIDDLDGIDRTRWKALPALDRLAVLLHTGDHHTLVRHGTRLVEGPLPSDAALRLRYPIAHEDAVWRHGAQHDVDPWLVLAIMRTESLYDPLAVSYAGARGAMQIMPRTGHLLADRTDDVGFTVNDLHDPDQAIGYGVRYLGLLLDRFDGVFPLAVASYNGGPHNVSSWLQALGPDVPMDVFVEHIPFGQTRRYVRKVSAVYGAYVTHWSADPESVHVPGRPLGDDPGVIDF